MTSCFIVRLGALGDLVHAMPVVAALRAARPGIRIGWAVHPRFVPLIQLVDGVDRIHPFDRGAGARALREVRNERYDVCLDLQGLLKSAAVARLSGAREVLGFSRPWLREPAAALLYSRTGGDGSGHVIDKNLSLLRLLGIEAHERRFDLTVPASPVVPCTRQLLDLAPDAPFAVSNPGAAWPNKRWRTERFGELARVLYARTGLRTAVVWGPDEATLAAAVVRASGGAAVMAPQTTMVEMLALVRAARVMISGDTGPIHLAAAVGTPVVGLYGPTPPGRNGPWDSRDRTVSAHEQCACVFRRRCTNDTWCLDRIEPAAVVDAVVARLEQA